MSSGIVVYYLAPKFHKATANVNFSANVSVTPLPSATAPSPPSTHPTPTAENDDEDDAEPAYSPPPPAPATPRPARPSWDATDPAPSEDLLVRQVKRSDGAALFVENRSACPITLTIQLDEKLNLVSNPPFPYTTTVAGKQKFKLADLSMYRPGRWSYSYTYKYSEGSTTAQHDRSFMYSLPYGSGDSHPLTLINGNEYHFAMPEDTPVQASRGGKVVACEDRYSRNGLSPEYFKKVNRVIIRHDDGTLGGYYYLRPGGVVVQVGQAVNAGDLIGYSGTTGHTATPQLAFCVFKALNGKSKQFFSLRFATSDSPHGAPLRTGVSYQPPTQSHPYTF
ncbi:M23 family metallopeptidase [bacterium]|nr:M23 family metallopeptidase [bacterium]